MNKATVKRIGISVIAIGGVVALIGSMSCANAGYVGANVFELIKYGSICLIGGLMCWLGGEIISLSFGMK